MKKLLLLAFIPLLFAGINRERNRDRSQAGGFSDDDDDGTTYTELIVSHDPALFYPFDGTDLSTQLNQDFSGNNKDGTFAGNPVPDGDGAGINTGTSVSFDRTGDTFEPTVAYS